MEAADITGLLRQWSGGDPAAFDRLVPLVYDELRRLAQKLVGREGDGRWMSRTALVHELYLKLSEQERAQWRDRQQFFGVAVKLMRRLMIDEARARQAAKRGAGVELLPVEEALDRAQEPGREVLAIDEALTRFAGIDPLRSQIVEWRYFGGMDLEEIADVLQVSRTTVKRHWTVARLWLHRELQTEFGE